MPCYAGIRSKHVLRRSSHPILPADQRPCIWALSRGSLVLRAPVPPRRTVPPAGAPCRDAPCRDALSRSRRRSKDGNYAPRTFLGYCFERTKEHRRFACEFVAVHWAIGAVVARSVHTGEVTGSNPVSPTKRKVPLTSRNAGRRDFFVPALQPSGRKTRALRPVPSATSLTMCAGALC